MSNKKIIRALILTAVLLSTLVSLCACGLVNPAGCKHVLGGVNKKIDLGEMGYCIGSLGYKYCFHCNNTIINEGGMNISCDFDTTETSTGEGENGSNYRADRSECKICGLVLEKGIVEYFEPNCKKMVVYAFRFLTPEGDLILEGNQYEGGEDHDFDLQYTMYGNSCEDGIRFSGVCKKCGTKSSEKITYHMQWFDNSIDLSALGMCGEESKFLISSCICGECVYGGINDAVDNNCDLENTNTTYVDNDGNEHVVREMYCPDCDSSISLDSVKNFDGTCEFYYNTKTKIVVKGETVVDGTYRRGGEIKHDYEYTYRLYGESCMDGTNYISVKCKKCGYIYCEGMFDGHAHEERIECDLTEYGICGDNSEFVVYPCPCNQDNWIYAHHSEACEVRDTGSGRYIDEQGREVSFMKQTCLKCHLTIAIYEYAVPGENCTATRYKQAVLSSDNVVLKDTGLVSQGESEYHVFEETYTMIGDSCQDGIKVVSSCKGCDLSYSWIADNHIYHTAETVFDENLADYGICGYKFSYEILACEACGEEKPASSYGFECCWGSPKHKDHKDHVERYSEKGDDGVVYDVMKSECCNCGYSVLEYTNYLEDGTIIKTTTIFKNDKIVFKYTYINS